MISSPRFDSAVSGPRDHRPHSRCRALARSTSDGGLVVDLGRMEDVRWTPGTHRADEQRSAPRRAGRRRQARGLVCPVGVVGHTGVAGLTLGGGIGRLQRQFGLTIDSLRAVELVTADGQIVPARPDEEPDLFWGLRGAGADFGIVTSLEFDLHPFAGTLHRGVHIHPRPTSTRSGRPSVHSPLRRPTPSQRSSRLDSASPPRTTRTPSRAGRSS